MEAILNKQDILTLDEKIKAHYTKFESDEKWVVYDGIVDLDYYNKSKYKVLWILKEINEVSDLSDKSDVENWDLRLFLNDGLRDGGKLKKGWGRTFQSIVLTTFGILNNCLWDEMDYIEKDPSMIDVVKNMAYINLKKQPGGAMAIYSQIAEFYIRDKEIIQHQIIRFNPDVIICGGTLGFIKDDLELSEENSSFFGHVKSYSQNNKIYIGAYHPANRSISQVEYCDDIINVVRNWTKNNGIA